MQFTLQLSLILLGNVALASFVGGFAANALLMRHLNPSAVKKRTGLSSFWQFGNAAVPIECYREEGHLFWRIRDRCLKTFAVCIGLVALVALAAAAFDIPLESPK